MLYVAATDFHLSSMTEGLRELSSENRVQVADDLIKRHEQIMKMWRGLRNEAIRELCAEVLSNGKPRGPAETARLLGMKLPTVKAINRRD